MTEPVTDQSAAFDLDLAVFRKSLPERMKLKEIIRALGSTEGEMCLDVGFMSGMPSYHLRKRGGAWHSVAVSADAETKMRAAVGENVYLMDEGSRLPFKDKVFDAVVVSDYLEKTRDDLGLVEECNRVLKPTGRLVLHANRIKTWSWVTTWRQLLGLRPDRLGMVRAGYTESELFHLLKQGFDVHSMRSHSRFFLECTDAWIQFLHRRIRDGNANKVRRLYALAAPLYWLSDQLDMLLVFSKGFQMVAGAKRRSWRARNAPILNDGRTISEAVLSKPGV